ncbi:hypothetical protein FD19_GL000821 [Lacticaseibacillus thailandensis DSM 22698 = JCM 13996]|uniref:Uncharacterized protein n=1 Tax=Lacticaseibacillus thailandensis DSM 22698 = JCM 13996 TaxID=1423810 RepID=A0A0R2CD73_9LACO|nr:hypothetical protein FD19_GL000821 [Lacticaseibacillus thailandensis DSM 22698 = JCM 13996]
MRQVHRHVIAIVVGKAVVDGAALAIRQTVVSRNGNRVNTSAIHHAVQRRGAHVAPVTSST